MYIIILGLYLHFPINRSDNLICCHERKMMLFQQGLHLLLFVRDNITEFS